MGKLVYNFLAFKQIHDDRYYYLVGRATKEGTFKKTGVVKSDDFVMGDNINNLATAVSTKYVYGELKFKHVDLEIQEAYKEKFGVDIYPWDENETMAFVNICTSERIKERQAAKDRDDFVI